MSNGSDVVAKLSEAMSRHDLEATLAFLTDDCVFEDTEPAPDGARYEGLAAIRAAWQPMYEQASIRFDTEEIFDAGDRVVQRSSYSWGDGHVRGVQVYRLRGDKVCEMLCYVKG